ncbi:MAG TPA: hypothetical protein VMB27_12925 [Solirubrobacteraceae bacterium]|nr:hypothetical protein [Solirubrobacteraceae bacterium]
MDGARPAWLIRMRWRRVGAWLWPSFVVLVVLDGVVGRLLPPAGTTETVFAAALLGLVLNVIAVILLSRPLGMLIRRFRPDIPGVVARDYAGTLVVFAVSATLLTAGLVHRPAIQARHRDEGDAIARAQAWIGDRAPDQFRRNLRFVSLLTIEPGTIYRACVPSVQGDRSYCVIVNRNLPFERSVTFSGYEPNSVLDEGAG